MFTVGAVSKLFSLLQEMAPRATAYSALEVFLSLLGYVLTGLVS